MPSSSKTDFSSTVPVGLQGELAMAALYQGLKVILNPGDEVIVIEPCWTNYLQQILMCGGVPVSVCADMENGFEYWIDLVLSDIMFISYISFVSVIFALFPIHHLLPMPELLLQIPD